MWFVDYTALGQAVREERLRNGWGLRTMARETGISPSQISQVERGLVLGRDGILEFCEFLDRPVDDFVVKPD